VASGCEPTAHVHSQLPFAAITAVFAVLAYSLMAFGLAGWIATVVAAALLVLFIWKLSKRQS